MHIALDLRVTTCFPSACARTATGCRGRRLFVLQQGDHSALRYFHLGIAGEGQELPDGKIEVRLTTRRFAWGVRVASPGFLPTIQYFGIEPGGERRIMLTPTRNGDSAPSPTVTAMNGEGHIPIVIRRSA